MSFIVPNDELTFSSSALDAGDALPVSGRSILGNYVQNNSNLPYLIDRVSNGAATQVYSNGVVNMSVSNSGDYAIAQTNKRHLYLAGQSQGEEMTLNEFDVVADCQKIVGYFNTDTVAPYNTGQDGVYLEMDGATYNLVIAKGGTLTKIPRANWNVDKLDGTGPSGLNIGAPNITNFTVVVFDFLYLGGTAVRLRFKIGEQLITAHIFRNSSYLPSTMINTPIHSLRWEIRSTGGVASMGQVCGSVFTGGALEVPGFPRTVFTGTASPLSLSNSGSIYLLLAIRLNAAKLDSIVAKIKASCMSLNNVYYQHYFLLNPTFSSAPTWVLENNPASLLINSGVDYAIGSGETVTGGIALNSDNGVARNSAALQPNSLFQPGSKIDGTQDVLVYAASGFSNNASISATIDFLNL